jgi:hypothetical protein
VGKPQAKQLGAGATSKEAARILSEYASPSATGVAIGNALAPTPRIELRGMAN